MAQIKLNKQQLCNLISESVKRALIERILGPGERFTPYTEKDREENFSGLFYGTPEERNPSYAQAKKEAQERLRKKKEMKAQGMVQEAVDYGWEVTSSEAMDAYNMAADAMGEDVINKAIVQCLSTEQLADCLAYIFRNYDFREWDEREV